MTQLATIDSGTLAQRQMAAGELRALVPDWLGNTDVAAASKKTYEQGVMAFLDWLPGHEGNVNAVRAWRDDMGARYTAASVNAWLSGIRSFFAWAHESGLVPYNPSESVKGLSRKGTNRRHKRDELTANEVKRVLATFDTSTAAGMRGSAILHLMAYCALRQVEVQRADVADLATKDGRLVLWVQGKGAEEKDDYVVLPLAAENSVRQWRAHHPTGKGPLFVSLGNRSKGQRLTRRAIRRIVKDAYRAAGVVGDAKTTHSLRHSAISTAIRGGAKVQAVQAMARHANLNTTMIYFHEIERTADPAEDYVSY